MSFIDIIFIVIVALGLLFGLVGKAPRKIFRLIFVLLAIVGAWAVADIGLNKADDMKLSEASMTVETLESTPDLAKMVDELTLAEKKSEDSNYGDTLSEADKSAGRAAFVNMTGIEAARYLLAQEHTDNYLGKLYASSPTYRNFVLYDTVAIVKVILFFVLGIVFLIVIPLIGNLLVGLFCIKAKKKTAVKTLGLVSAVKKAILVMFFALPFAFLYPLAPAASEFVDDATAQTIGTYTSYVGISCNNTEEFQTLVDNQITKSFLLKTDAAILNWDKTPIVNVKKATGEKDAQGNDVYYENNLYKQMASYADLASKVKDVMDDLNKKEEGKQSIMEKINALVASFGSSSDEGGSGDAKDVSYNGGVPKAVLLDDPQTDNDSNASQVDYTAIVGGVADLMDEVMKLDSVKALINEIDSGNNSTLNLVKELFGFVLKDVVYDATIDKLENTIKSYANEYEFKAKTNDNEYTQSKFETALDELQDDLVYYNSNKSTMKNKISYLQEAIKAYEEVVLKDAEDPGHALKAEYQNVEQDDDSSSDEGSLFTSLNKTIEGLVPTITNFLGGYDELGNIDFSSSDFKFTQIIPAALNCVLKSDLISGLGPVAGVVGSVSFIDKDGKILSLEDTVSSLKAFAGTASQLMSVMNSSSEGINVEAISDLLGSCSDDPAVAKVVGDAIVGALSGIGEIAGDSFPISIPEEITLDLTNEKEVEAVTAVLEIALGGDLDSSKLLGDDENEGLVNVLVQSDFVEQLAEENAGNFKEMLPENVTTDQIQDKLVEAFQVEGESAKSYDQLSADEKAKIDAIVNLFKDSAPQA